jgi:hypothetical protein
MIEVAGADTATLNALGNTGAQICGMAVPVLGVWLRQVLSVSLSLSLSVSLFSLRVCLQVLFALFGRVTCPADDPDWGKKKTD